MIGLGVHVHIYVYMNLINGVPFMGCSLWGTVLCHYSAKMEIYKNDSTKYTYIYIYIFLWHGDTCISS